MHTHSSSTLSSKVNWGPLKIAGLYLLIGGLWILFSDRLAAQITSDPVLLTKISLYKCWGYIFVTALLLYWLIRRQNTALRGGEEQLRLITDAFPALISYVDADKRYQFNNKAYEDWFGHEAQGKHLEEVLGNVAYQTISGYVDNVLKGETVTYETEIPYKDGGTRFVHATYVPDRGTNGQVKGFFALVQDITESKQAEEELRQWADAFDGCAHGIAIDDPSTNRIMACNSAFASMHKSRVEDVVGTAILSLYAPPDRGHVRRSIEKADQIGHSRFEAHMIRRDGSAFPVQMDVVSVWGNDGDLLHRVATVVDITERKQAEEALHESEERYRIIFELTNDYAYEDRVEPDGRIIPEWITSGVSRITGYTFDDMNAPDFWQRLAHPEDISILIRHIQHILSGQADTAEIRIITKNGEVRWLQDSAHPIWDAAQGRVTHMYGAALDVTERKQAEEALRESESNARSLLRLSKRLEQAQTYSEALDAALEEVKTVLGYQNVWTYLLSEDKQYLRLLTITGEKSQVVTEDFPALTIKGDHFLEEIAYGRDIVLVEDARIDPRTNKDIVAQLGNRTIVNIPIILMDTHLGAFGTGSFGEEGVRIPTPTQLDYLRALASHMAVTLDRIHLLAKRKQAEEKISYQAYLLENVNDAIIGSDENSLLTFWNHASEKMFGWSAGEVLGRSAREILRSEFINTDRETTLRTLATARNWQGEALQYRKDGTQVISEIHSMALHDANGSVTGYVSVNRDITERKQVEEALQRARDELEFKVQERTAALSQANTLLQALMDYMPDHIYFKDTESRFIRNSKSQANMLGLSEPNQIVGKTDFDFFPHAMQAYAEEQEVMRSGQPLVDFEEQVVWPDSRETWVSTTKVPLRNPEGQIIGIFGISRDITERKRVEQSIQQLNADLKKQAAQLEAANKELEAFSYSVSHDLRAPLRAIDGFTRILLEDYEPLLDEEGKRVGEIIRREAQHMGELIDDLLAFSRLGRKEMHFTKIDMKAMASSVFDELMTMENVGRIDFHVHRLSSTAGDPVLIRQVWVNLLSNAIKFSSKKEQAVIEVGSKHSEDEHIYYVRDTGAGFEMEYMDKLFGVFQRLHGEKEFEGTGVGLAIVKRVINRHDGRVWAEGEVGKGATFYFALPRKRE